ncbi:hypothetical protein ACFL9U_12095, partial [Thermodesulfobacteriota bacterium]
GIIRQFIEREQILLATLFSIFLLISMVAFIIYFREKRKIVFGIGLASLCLVIGVGLFLML